MSTDAGHFYPHNAMLTRVLAVIVYLSVCYMTVLFRNSCTDQAVFLFTSFSQLMLRYILDILINKRVFHSGTLSQTLDLENFTTTCQLSASAIQTATVVGLMLTGPGGDGRCGNRRPDSQLLIALDVWLCTAHTPLV